MPSKSSQSSWGNNHFTAARNWPHCLASSYWLWSKILKKDIPTHKSTPNYRKNTVANTVEKYQFYCLFFFSISGATPNTAYSRINVVLLRLCPTHALKCRIEEIIHIGQAIWAFKLLDYLFIEIFVLNYLNVCLGSFIHFLSVLIG